MIVYFPLSTFIDWNALVIQHESPLLILCANCSSLGHLGALLGCPIFLSMFSLYSLTSCPSWFFSLTTWSLLVGMVFRNHILDAGCAHCPEWHSQVRCVTLHPSMWSTLKSWLHHVLVSSFFKIETLCFLLQGVYWPVTPSIYVSFHKCWPIHEMPALFRWPLWWFSWSSA